MAYQSKYTGLQIDDILDSVEWKQGKIEDLASIRAGAQKGATALQSYTEKYTGTVTGIKINGVVKSGSGVIDLGTITTDISGKVDKVAGKQLSTEDFTTALKNKLEGLSNYDDTELSDAIETLRGDFDNIVSGDTTTAIKTFNEVIAFLDGLTDTQDLESIIASIEQQIAGKMDTLISGTNIKTINGESILGSGDLTIEGGANIYKWFYDSESESVTLSQEEYDNIVDADLVVVNFGGLLSCAVTRTGKDFSEELGNYILTGQVDLQGSKMYLQIDISIATKLATFTIEQQEIPTQTSQLENDSNFVTPEDVAAVALSGSYNDLHDAPAIPSAVTESTVSGWGFTKNAGTYSKPSGGIPKSDLASAVQTSLGKADTALQSYTEQYKGTITGVSANGTSVATSGVANIPAASTSAYGVTKLSSATNSTSTTLAATASAVKAAYDLANGKQAKLVSGTNIKTINGESILGSGDIEISGGAGGDYLPLTGGTITGDLVITSGTGGFGNLNAPHVTADVFTGGKFIFDNNYWLRNEGYDLQYCDNNDESVLTLTYQGDGTKFLSNDGTYKTISGGSSSTPQIITITGTIIRLGVTESLVFDGRKYVCPAPAILVELGDSLDGIDGEIPGDYGEVSIIFTAGDDLSLMVPRSLLWANGQIPVIEEGVSYELSLVASKVNNAFVYKAVLTPFKPV